MAFLQICGRSYKRSYKRPDTFLQRSYKLLDVPTKSCTRMGAFNVRSAAATERACFASAAATGLRKWHASFGTRDLQLPAPSRNNFQYLWSFLPLPGGLRDHVELNAAQVRRHAAHKRWHNAFRSYNARLDPEELTNKNAHHYCPTICAIQKKKLLNHKGSGMPRPTRRPLCSLTQRRNGTVKYLC